MPYSMLKENDIRAIAKEHLEGLEFWLRIVIDHELRQVFGSNYVYARKENGDYVFNKTIREEIINRFELEPQRYSRPIDACFLETSIKIITKPDLYRAYFEDYFKLNFSIGREMILLILNRLVIPRNQLYHANAISLRAFEQIICYSNDIVDSIKENYKIKNMDKEFNVPRILKITDSFGNSLFREQFNPKDLDIARINYRKQEFILFPGDKLRIDIEVDPTFSRGSYTINWGSSKGIPEMGDTNSITLTIEEKHIGESMDIQCKILTKKPWHRHGHGDDFFLINYKVLERK